MMNYEDKDEKTLFSKVLDQVKHCQKTGFPSFTDFFDPIRGARFLSTLSQQRGIFARAFGGFEGCERQMLGFSCDGELDDDSFPIALLKITYNAKFSRELTHRDYLGSVLSLGLVRDKVGDIFCKNDLAFLFVHSDIASYIECNLEKIANTKVKITRAHFDEFFALFQEFQSKRKEITVTLSSLRLDAFVASAFKLSRGDATDLITAEKVFINWALCSNNSKPLKEGDVVTCRGKGRFKVLALEGKSRKERLIVRLEVF